ncbi:hypothetical protein FSARC_7506 [Fusarium sarcochroum]|uniref:Zn(2)-C6 fungal-type domain-containing protein n=1 Tax=Fusarium sarcochroum TaxID=1208366 RepID=A0A8H4TV80_9HYPO|nr:hypothetical protein FSARC_7506 [Fusarium sarcochroum]
MSPPAMNSMNACLPCRKVKMKCCPGSSRTSKCERCARKSLDCVFRQHRRGRKPGTKIKRSNNASVVSAHTSPCPENPSPTVNSHFSETDQDIDNLQPSGLLNHEALKGKFSLGSILNASEEPVLQCMGNLSDPTEDPIDLGLINPSIAKSLFDSFITVLNPYISQLDPHLHTFAYVRQKSVFLLSAVLAMSAKAFNPVLYDKLYNHAQDLFAKVFRRGSKSTEIVQAILILTYWKEPQDTRVWTSIGYTIRMCMDMGWHKLAPSSTRGDITQSELDKREQRNIERTWYVLFVYDRSISLQTGRPWMIECDDFIESIEDWCDDPLAIENDQLLGAFTTLRLVTSAAFALLIPRSQRRVISHNESEPLVNLLNGRIQRWEDRWTQKVTSEQYQGCHKFLIRFYGTHLRLQLHTLPLHGILTSDKSDITLHLDTIWVAYTSALNMLQLISQYSDQLYFAQDSIHVMTAYSAAFLVKASSIITNFTETDLADPSSQILLSVPSLISTQVESNTIQAIQNAAQVFSNQSSSISSSCTLQARFLERVWIKLVENQNKRDADRSNANTAGPLAASLMTANQDDISGGLRARSMFDAADQQAFDSVSSEIPFLPQGSLDFPFECEDMWAELFATVGLNTQDELHIS